MLSGPGVVQSLGLLNLKARPAPRPFTTGKFDRYGKPIVMMPEWYPKYKQDIVSLLGQMIQPEVDFWFGIYLEFAFSYPQNTPKRLQIEGALTSVLKDNDNLSKGIMDALKTAKVVPDDSVFAASMAVKLRTCGEPYIKLFLYGYNDSVKIQQVGPGLPGIYIAR